MSVEEQKVDWVSDCTVTGGGISSGALVFTNLRVLYVPEMIMGDSRKSAGAAGLMFVFGGAAGVSGISALRAMKNRVVIDYANEPVDTLALRPGVVSIPLSSLRRVVIRKDRIHDQRVLFESTQQGTTDVVLGAPKVWREWGKSKKLGWKETNAQYLKAIVQKLGKMVPASVPIVDEYGLPP